MNTIILPMTKTFTEDDLVSYIYGELDIVKYEEISRSLLMNASLRNQLNSLRKVVESVDRFVVKAPAGVVSRILDASRHQHSV